MNAITRLKLHSNWGPRADALDCYAEIKYIDPLSNWACYIYAINPEDDEEMSCLVHNEDSGINICDWSYTLMMRHFNKDGEFPIVDDEYRRMQVPALLKRLSNGR